MKKVLFAAGLLLYVTAAFAVDPPEVSEKVLNAFKQTFYNPKEVAWYAGDNGSYEVYFKCGDITSKVWYDKEGNITTAYRYYSESSLPPVILGKIKMKYSDKTVFGVTEISNDAGVYYYVKLEDAKNWITIKADALGVLEVYEKLRKA